MLHGTSLSSLFDCYKCSTIERKARGCKRNRRSVIVFDCDCICEGKEKCSICGGIKKGNTIRVRRCPRAILKEHVSRVVPYFYRFLYTQYTQYPDGRGMCFQPNKLIAALDILLVIYGREEKLKRAMADGKA